jgi:hypothetical protein
VKIPENGLNFVARVFVHLKDHDAVKFSGHFEGVSHLNGFRVAAFRRRDCVPFQEKAAALPQGAFRRAGEMGHAELGIRPDRNRGEGTAVRVSEKNHAAPHAS